MKVVLPVSLNSKVENKGTLPVCVLLAKKVFDKALTEVTFIKTHSNYYVFYF